MPSVAVAMAPRSLTGRTLKGASLQRPNGICNARRESKLQREKRMHKVDIALMPMNCSWRACCTNYAHLCDGGRSLSWHPIVHIVERTSEDLISLLLSLPRATCEHAGSQERAALYVQLFLLSMSHHMDLSGGCIFAA